MTESKEDKELNRLFQLAGTAAVTAIAIGTVVYHFVEKLSWLDAAYFSVITLATVGYGDIAPKTDVGKIFTIFYVIAGIGIIATFANIMIRRAGRRRERRTPK